MPAQPAWNSLTSQNHLYLPQTNSSTAGLDLDALNKKIRRLKSELDWLRKMVEEMELTAAELQRKKPSGRASRKPGTGDSKPRQ